MVTMKNAHGMNPKGPFHLCYLSLLENRRQCVLLDKLGIGINRPNSLFICTKEPRFRGRRLCTTSFLAALWDVTFVK